MKSKWLTLFGIWDMLLDLDNLPIWTKCKIENGSCGSDPGTIVLPRVIGVNKVPILVGQVVVERAVQAFVQQVGRSRPFWGKSEFTTADKLSTNVVSSMSNHFNVYTFDRTLFRLCFIACSSSKHFNLDFWIRKMTSSFFFTSN